jgi:cell division ATPase FtsA
MKEQIKMMNDVISSVACYAAGEFTESQFENRMRDLKQPEEVIEHAKTVVELTNAHFDKEEAAILFS